MEKGRIISGVGGFYYVRTLDGRVHECRAAGRFRKERVKPLVGDYVLIDPKTGTTTGSVREILPRENQLRRPKAANVDLLLVVVCPREPAPDFGLADKLILQARTQGVEPVLCVNKKDLDPERAERIAKSYEGACRALAISAVSEQGMEPLLGMLEGKTTCLAGQSAVGKSTLLNDLCGAARETGGLSAKTDRGRHTTRSVELFWSEKARGYILDTPGFSVFDVASLDPREIGEHCGDFRPYLEKCQFASCLHRDEPGCAVKRAVEEGKIDKGRYDRYLAILKEREEAQKW